MARRMGAAPVHHDLDMVGRGHDAARPHGEAAHLQPRQIVHAVDLADGEAGEQPVVDHRLGAGPALLRRLEDEHGGAGEGAGLGEVARGAEQHGGVAVMAAGVHLAGRLRGIGGAGLFQNGQRVHVGAQADERAIPLAAH
jgi:hypothetical protein